MIRIKLRENGKAVIRFNNPAEEQYFMEMMRSIRDGKFPHPQISLKNRNGDEVPPLPPKPPIQMEKGSLVIASGIQVQMGNMPAVMASGVTLNPVIKKIDASGL